MGMSIDVESKIISKEDYNKFLNGKVYLDNYVRLNFVNKQEVDAEMTKVKEFLEKNVLNETFNEKYLRIYSCERWEDRDWEENLNTNGKLLEDSFFDNLKYFQEGHTYFTINEWLNYEDDSENYVERIVDKANINGQEIYCLIDTKFW